jgi:hypothetical protein
VADAVFVLRVELGSGFFHRWEIEQRVIAEAVAAARRARDLAAPDALGDERPRIVRVAQEHHDAGVIGASVLAQIQENLLVVARVALFAAARAPGVISRVHAGLAAERVDAKARVVGERRQPGGAAGVARLGERVLEKGGVGFSRLANGQFLLWNDFNRQRREQGLDLPQLAGIARGEDQLHSPRDFFCC